MEQAERISGVRVQSITHKTFWIQAFFTAMARIEAHQQTVEKVKAPIKPLTFKEFIANNLHLVYEDLRYLYYSPNGWKSQEALDTKFRPTEREQLSN
jgi:hypothetical protein